MSSSAALQSSHSPPSSPLAPNNDNSPLALDGGSRWEFLTAGEFQRALQESPASRLSISSSVELPLQAPANRPDETAASEPEDYLPGESTMHSDSALSRNTFPGMTVDEHHSKYILMYDMLTGIRIAVSRCQGQPPRHTDLFSEEDFAESVHLAFDSTGTEFTPSSKYEFKFKDYAPWVFHSLREAFQIDAADYLVSLTGKYVLSELCSPGKSGSFFYYSQDFRFIIKTIRKNEHEYLRKVLPAYYKHMRANPNSLLTRFFGLHRVKTAFNPKRIYFVVMGNIFPSNLDIHEIYDLKVFVRPLTLESEYMQGALQGRMSADNTTDHARDEDSVNTRTLRILKDLDWIDNRRRLRLGPVKANILMNQLKSDCVFLARIEVMDYSLLVGLHFLARGNREHLFDRGMSVVEHNPEDHHQFVVKQKPSMPEGDGGAASMVMMANPFSTEHSTLDPSLNAQPHERQLSVFFGDLGGFRATYRNDRPADELYFLGIIDILTPYGKRKKLEHVFKSLRYSSDAISTINPVDYARRFLNFAADFILRYPPSRDHVDRPLPPIDQLSQ